MIRILPPRSNKAGFGGKKTAMKLKIEFESPASKPDLHERVKALQMHNALNFISGAVKKPETAELLSGYEPGEQFSMNDDRRNLKIIFTVIEK